MTRSNLHSTPKTSNRKIVPGSVAIVAMTTVQMLQSLRLQKDISSSISFTSKPYSTKVGVSGIFALMGVIFSVSVPLSAQANTSFDIADNYCKGKVRDGLIQGNAECVFPSGNRYMGELRGGVRDGTGVFTFADGSRCEGQFKNDFLNGRGICTFPGGNRYEGEFRNNQRHGQGTLILTSGIRCQGIFQNDELEGTGVCTYPSGNRYEGTFRNQRRQGRGILTLANGVRCDGIFDNDWLNGFAVCTYPSGMRYEGEFRTGKQAGRGVFISADGSRVEGIWKNGKFVETRSNPIEIRGNKLNSIELKSPLAPTLRLQTR